MNDEPHIQVISVPLGDTGLGRAAGFKDDAELIAKAKAERKALPPEIRKMADEMDAEFERRVLFGEG